jgi:cytidine deaminase
MSELTAEQSELLEAAKNAASQAYAPYSKFPVGAALLDEHGVVWKGVNVENGSYGLTICAERNAVAAMATSGARKVVAIAIFAGTDEPITPCGACRQVIAEFGLDAVVVCGCRGGGVLVTSARELLPMAFTLDSE